MNVSLTPELERFVEDHVKSGMYQTASEVVREGLRLLAQRQHIDIERAAVARGLAELARGEHHDYPDAKSLFRARGLKRLKAARKARK